MELIALAIVGHVEIIGTVTMYLGNAVMVVHQGIRAQSVTQVWTRIV